MNLKTMTMVLAVGFAAVAGAMTQTELQAAIDAASPGDTVYVTSDLEYSSTLNVNKKLTLASEEGKAYAISRAASYSDGQFLNVASADADLTICDLVISGNKSAGHTTKAFITMNAGTLTLGRGTVLKDYYRNVAGTIELLGTSEMIMEEGAVISGMENSSYAVAVRVSSSFKMTGGLITGCAGHYGSSSTGYDGTVYVYGGTFTATGGTITGNTSDNAVAGVLCYTGKFDFGGGFTSTNNIGKSGNDVLIRSACPARILSDYTGWMTVKFENYVPENGWMVPNSITTSVENEPRKGCLNIVAEDAPTLGCEFDPLYQSANGIWRSVSVRIAGRANKKTFSDAIAAAVSGDTIELLKDSDYTARCDLQDKDLTIRSVAGKTCSFNAAASNAGFMGVTGGKLRLENVIVDGHRESYTIGAWNDFPGMLTAYGNGTIELGAGCVLRNACSAENGSALSLRQAGSRVIMEEGAIISNCTASGRSYGSVIRVGKGEDVTPLPTFEMRGGLITGNDTGPDEGTKLGGYSGIIYLYKGEMDMSGGTITGNTSLYGCSTVLCYSGDLLVTGSARITGNSGPYPGVYSGGDYRVRIYGDLRGVIDVSSPSQDKGGYPRIMGPKAGGDFTGAWCFRAANSTVELVGYRHESYRNYVYWDSPIGGVGEAKVARASDLEYIVPTSLDLSEGSADRQRLPLVFTGAATSLGGTVALSYDPNVLRKSGDLPLTLFAPGEGETLTGEWTYSYPAYRKGCWEVLAGDDGTQSLHYQPDGLIMLLY